MANGNHIPTTTLETVFLEEDEGVYEGLGNFILELETLVNVPEAPKSKVESERIFRNSEGDEKLTDELFKLSFKQYSDED